MDNDGQNPLPDAEFLLTPLKRYVTVVGNKKDSKWLCTFGCKDGAYTGSYTRIRAHLIGLNEGEKAQGIILCPNVGAERDRLRKEEENARDVYGPEIRKRIRPDAPTTGGGKKHAGSSSTSGGGVHSVGAIKSMFNMVAREDTDTRVSRFFYGCGIPFNVARSPLWADAVRAINDAPKGYRAPGSEKLRTSLLDKERTNVDGKLMMLKQDWPAYGVSIVSDGWSNVRNQPLLNVLAVCGGKPIFLKAIDTSGAEKNAEYISEILLKAIEEVGKYNVIQVLTDNAANCKAAGDIIVGKLPHIYWSGCMPHTLSLLMKDIANSQHPSLTFVGLCYKKVKDIVNYVRNHSFVLHLFRQFSSTEVIQVKKTRFGSHYVVMKRILNLRGALQSMVISDEWDTIQQSTQRTRDAHEAFKADILIDSFWKELKLVLSFTEPIWKMIRFCDSDKPVIGEVYQRMEDMIGLIKEAVGQPENLEMRQELEDLAKKRWEKMNKPLHALAYVLNPFYYSNKWLQSKGPGNKERVKPHTDPVVQNLYLDAVQKLLNAQDASAARQQLSDFTLHRGVFSRVEAFNDRADMAALTWWNLYGASARELCSLATKVLSQNVNSSSAERVWSSYNFIHGVKRNRLNCDRAESLVFVHYNNRILTRYDDDYEKKYRNWDRNTYEDYIEGDLEAVEDGELQNL